MAALDNSKYIEYKWITVGTVSKTDFLNQFVKRDLFNKNLISLSQLEWRIKGNKLSKEKVLEYLSSKEGREALKKLGTNKVKTLFPKQAKQINEDNFINILINNLNKDEIYNSVFR